MVDKLKGKVCVTTGSGQGIGRGIALAIAREGAAIVTNNRFRGTPGGDAETTAKEIIDAGGQAVSFFGDVSESEVCHRLIKTAVDNFGRLDILVNNAGVGIGGTIWNTTEEAFNIAVDSHLRGTFNCIRYALELMKEQRWGRIINCTSNSWLGTPGLCVYSAVKAGIVGLTRSVACDVVEHGITCNAYHPFAATRLVPTGENGAMDRNVVNLIRRRYELGLIDKEEYEWQTHPPSAEGVGPFIAYLATDEAAYINGRVFYASGGKAAIYSEPIREKTIIKKEGIWTVEELIEQVPNLLLKA